MDIRCTPKTLEGQIDAPSSKSEMHRALICAFLSEEPTKIYCNCISDDVKATINCLKKMGAQIKVNKKSVVVNPMPYADKISINCKESGSTLRFLLPVISALSMDAKITAEGNLPKRPIMPLLKEMEKNGVTLNKTNEFPIHISGELKAGDYKIEGNISSQFISGLLFALPLVDGDSTITVTTPLQSKPYVDVTLNMLKKFGVFIDVKDNKYIIKGNQEYITPDEVYVEGDWSNSAVFLCAGALSKKGVTVRGLNINSAQGDKKIVSLLKLMGADVSFKDDSITVKKDKLVGTIIDASDIPDIIPYVAVTASMCQIGATHITNAERLKIKESNRLQNIDELLSKLGAASLQTDDGLVIWGKNDIIGGAVSGFNDHRMIMAAALISCDSILPIDIEHAEAINKSYPNFFSDFNRLGGNAEIINSKN